MLVSRVLDNTEGAANAVSRYRKDPRQLTAHMHATKQELLVLCILPARDLGMETAQQSGGTERTGVPK